MEINEHILKLVGEASLPEGLEIGKDYLVSINGSIVKKSESPTEDGKMDMEYRFKALSCEVLKESGKTIKSIDKKRDSQKHRAMINYYRKEKFPEIEEEDFYHSYIGKSMSNFDEICRLLEKLK